MRRTTTALVLAAALAVAGALAAMTAAPAGAGDGSPGSSGSGSDSIGLEGHELRFTVTSKRADTACVSYYETTGKRGPAKHFERVTNELVDLPFTTTVGTTAKAKHWALAAWATTDCATTTDPDGTVRCLIKVDGKRKARASATDAIAFCFA